jgi:tetratricopeptide (TPR) repeat protein
LHELELPEALEVGSRDADCAGVEGRIQMLSWVAMERIVAESLPASPKRQRRAKDRPMRSDVIYLTDAELLQKLHELGVDVDRRSLERLCDQSLSAEEITKSILERPRFEIRERFDEDRIWICLLALWQRWFPEKPCFELLDDRMQAGYDLRTRSGPEAACRVWLEVWSDVLRIADRTGICTIREFDERFRGSQFLFNWIQDVEDDLWTAGMRDRRFLQARVAVCEEGLRRFASESESLVENRRLALAESYFELGEIARAESLYGQWLRDDPQWSWAWIGWSDRYRFTRSEARDPQKAELILREGLGVADLRDRGDVAERLADLYAEQGRKADAEEVRLQAQARARVEEASRASGAALTGPAADVQKKVGRNEPCPCGSGRKFKKCCGA